MLRTKNITSDIVSFSALILCVMWFCFLGARSLVYVSRVIQELAYAPEPYHPEVTACPQSVNNFSDEKLVLYKYRSLGVLCAQY